MKFHIHLVLLFIVTVVINGCSGNTATSAATTAPTEPSSLNVGDQASLIAALEAAGATVEVSQPISQAFFGPEGTIIKVNGADVLVFDCARERLMGIPAFHLPTRDTPKSSSSVLPDTHATGGYRSAAQTAW